MIVTIDGPAGAGKSTVARRLADRLGFQFLDTGATYRAVTWAALEHGVDWTDSERLIALARRLAIELTAERVTVDDREVTEAIRTPEVTRCVCHVADNVAVREHLVALQRRLAQGRDVVAEGRDQGTVVFPDAQCKIYLTASPHERALRRHRELAERGRQVPLDELLEQQNRRDAQDGARPVGRLTPAADAIEVNTDGLSLEEVVDRLEATVRQQMSR